jgi:hypothetical protein
VASITKSVSTEKWEKGVAILSAPDFECNAAPSRRPMLDRKQLERDVGFLNHLAMTFEETTPFLKGFYLTLNSWRLGRDDDDWKVTQKVWSKLIAHRREREPEWGPEADVKQTNSDAPDKVKASPRFADDVGALLSLLRGDGPPVVQLRSRFIVSVVFGVW